MFRQLVWKLRAAWNLKAASTIISSPRMLTCVHPAVSSGQKLLLLLVPKVSLQHAFVLNHVTPVTDFAFPG